MIDRNLTFARNGGNNQHVSAVAPNILDQMIEVEKVLDQLAQLNQLNSKMRTNTNDNTDSAPELAGF